MTEAFCEKPSLKTLKTLQPFPISPDPTEFYKWQRYYTALKKWRKAVIKWKKGFKKDLEEIMQETDSLNIEILIRKILSSVTLEKKDSVDERDKL